MNIQKIVQMVTRGLIVLLMSLGLLFHLESEFMNSITAFLASGVFGSCFVVSVGLMIEAGLQIYHSDNAVECSFCAVGILLNIAMLTSAFYKFTRRVRIPLSILPKMNSPKAL